QLDLSPSLCHYSSPPPTNLPLLFFPTRRSSDLHQKIVEIMRHAARQPADRLDLLRLAQRLLDARPFRHLDAELLVGFGQRAGPQIGRATSELQSLAYLVCRLLLEKKKSACH